MLVKKRVAEVGDVLADPVVPRKTLVQWVLYGLPATAMAPAGRRCALEC